MNISRISRESKTQTAVQAQTTDSLSGTVADQNGAVMAGANVTLLSTVATGERSAITDSNGAFDFQALFRGTYTINVEAKDFKKAITRDIVISVSLNTPVNVQLEIGLAGESVTVTAAQEAINTVSPSLTNVISTRQVVDLPLPTRNLLELAGLQAGIAITGTDVRGFVHCWPSPDSDQRYARRHQRDGQLRENQFSALCKCCQSRSGDGWSKTCDGIVTGIQIKARTGDIAT